MAQEYDVIVVGAGNAALSAAIAAKDSASPCWWSRRPPSISAAATPTSPAASSASPSNGIDDIKALIPDMSETEENSIEVGQYTEDMYYDDMMRVTHGLSDPELAQILVSNSHPTMSGCRNMASASSLSFGRQAFWTETSTGSGAAWWWKPWARARAVRPAVRRGPAHGHRSALLHPGCQAAAGPEGTGKRPAGAGARRF